MISLNPVESTKNRYKKLNLQKSKHQPFTIKTQSNVKQKTAVYKLSI